MPTKIEKDVVSGRDTTGHEWDGLKELNTPLPKWWVYVMYATIVWSAVWFVLYPSVPGVSGYFHGVLGYSQRTAVNDDVRAVMAQRAGTMDRIRSLSFADIRKDPELMAAASMYAADQQESLPGNGWGTASDCWESGSKPASCADTATPWTE